jgi:hypothetical protein
VPFACTVRVRGLDYLLSLDRLVWLKKICWEILPGSFFHHVVVRINKANFG